MGNHQYSPTKLIFITKPVKPVSECSSRSCQYVKIVHQNNQFDNEALCYLEVHVLKVMCCIFQ